MKEGFRQCMAWLHTWVGLVVGWVLFFIFITGTAGYVDDEVTRWMKPELPVQSKPESIQTERALQLALARLQEVASGAKSWAITLPHQSLNPRAQQGLSVSWEEMPQDGQRVGRRGSESVDILTGQFKQEIETRATGGGTGLYRMHYLLHYMPRTVGIMLVGACTMLMLLAVISGVITHKKIFTDFFTFRPGKGQRSWLDAHTVVGVMSLPFFLMITYTGLVFFANDYMPAGRDVVYGTTQADRTAYFDELLDRDPNRNQLSHLPLSIPVVPLEEFVRRGETQWGSDRVNSVRLVHPENGVLEVELRPIAGSTVGGLTQPLRFNGADGSPLTVGGNGNGNAARSTQRVLLSLHEGHFSDWWLRWLYFISGLLGCAVIATGLVHWTVKRRTQHLRGGASRFDAQGLRLVEVLNAGTIIGLPIAVAAYFWANRLLPVGMADRVDWEFHCLFIAWGWALLYASVRPLKKAWLELLWMAAAAYVFVPVVNALTTDKHLGITLPHALHQGDWVLAGFDLTMLGLAGVFAYAAFKVRSKWLGAVPQRGAESLSAAEAAT